MDINYNRLLRIRETIFDLTVNCYHPLIVKYEDSRTVCQTILAWADEFEDWWESLSEDEQYAKDYLLSIDEFSERHLRSEIGQDA